MKIILCLLIALMGRKPAMADSTFGLPNVAESSTDDLRFVHEHVLAKEFHAMSSKMSLEDIFKMRPAMDHEGDRGPRGREYFEEISKANLFRKFNVQKDGKGVHNIEFSSAFLTPPTEQIWRTVSWLLTVNGNPSEVFTRDLSPSVPGDELIAVVWKRQDQTVGLSFHWASGLHSTIVVARAGTSAQDLFSVSGSKKKSTMPADVRSLIADWISSIDSLRNAKAGQPATQPADKPPLKDQPSPPPTSRDSPR